MHWSFSRTHRIDNKKVLLRERKRHTTRRVASTHYAVPDGVYPLSWDLTWTPFPGLDGGGYPFPGLDRGGGTPFQVWMGEGVTQSQVWKGVQPPSQVCMGGTPIRKDGGPPLSGKIGGSPPPVRT